jgi:7-cyano-7-deazaguanine tRNA-ribosyltransferase
VALGCDLFDSAAYALYAREDRYMTEHGTAKLGKLQFFPCSCPICIKNNPKDLKDAPKPERMRLLTQHNLYVCFSEIKRIRQVVVEGRLWEYLEMKTLSHPSLHQALKRLKKYEDYIERYSPVTKRSGIFFFSSAGLCRPEVVRHRKRLLKNYEPPKDARILVLLPQTATKPFHKSKEQKKLVREVERQLGERSNRIHFCTYAAPFGVIPTEIDEVYPLSQHEISLPFDIETLDYVAKEVENYIAKTNYETVILLESPEVWRGKISAACQRVCKKRKIPLTVIKTEYPWSKRSFDEIILALKKLLDKLGGSANAMI